MSDPVRIHHAVRAAVLRDEPIRPYLQDLVSRGLTVRQIGERLRSYGFRPVRAARWAPAVVHELLTRNGLQVYRSVHARKSRRARTGH
jgi:hypothetical protein